MAMAIPRWAVFPLGNFRDRTKPERRYLFRKPTASLRARGHAALLPLRCRERDVRPGEPPVPSDPLL